MPTLQLGGDRLAVSFTENVAGAQATIALSSVAIYQASVTAEDDGDPIAAIAKALVEATTLALTRLSEGQGRPSEANAVIGAGITQMIAQRTVFVTAYGTYARCIM